MTEALEQVVAAEMRHWGIGGVALALVDDQRVVYASGFGQARRDSIFRVGSISKLLNAIAVMQQNEATALSLDAALPPDVLPLNPFPDNPPVTLRQTLCHRSGMQREATVGGYFDESGPGLAATVASVRPCVLATRPGEATRYSNLAPSIAGLMVERATGLSFEDYQRRHILDPVGMTSSAWSLAHTARDRLPASRMRVAGGNGNWKSQTAPLFDLGTIPAGNLFSTVDDLARFASALMADGGGLVKPETLREMWRVQYASDDPPAFGLGFIIGQFHGHRMISHGGAVYGHSSYLGLLPDAKVAVVVLANEDLVNGRTRHIANAALSHLVEAKLGDRPPGRENFSTPPNLENFAGDYESQSFWARLETRDGQLMGDISGQPAEFQPAGGLNFALSSRLEDATPVVFEDDGGICGFQVGPQHFRRVRTPAPALPPEWRAFCGCYGPDFIPLVVSERHGHLYAMTENMADYRLTPMNRNTCALPVGMYWGEHAVFLTDGDGVPRAVNLASMTLPRRMSLE